MAGTNTRQGFRTDAAFVRETTYGTVLAVTKKLPHLLKNLIRKKVPDVPNLSLVGNRGPNQMLAGEPMLSGPISMYHSFGEVEPWVAAAVGGSTVNNGTSPYEYTYEPTDDMKKAGSDTKAHSFTLAQRLEAGTNEVREYAGVKPRTWKMSGKVNEAVVSEFDCTAKARNDASGTNGDTQLNAATAVGADILVFRSSIAVVRLGDLVDALVAGDNVNALEFEFAVDNKQDELYGSEGLEEPEPEDFPGIVLKLKLPRLDTTTYRTWVDAKTRLQALLQFTHPTLANNLIELRAGAMTLRDDFGEEVDGPALIMPTLTFDLHRAALGNPTWTGMQESFQYYIKSTLVASDPFPA